MPREKFSDSELKAGGTYPAIHGFPTEPKYLRPVTPLANWKLFLEGETPYWIPRNGRMTSDARSFFPRVHPDNIAERHIIDGGSPFHFTSDIIKSKCFDLEWVFVPVAGGATVRPGKPKVPDICRWEEYVSMPELDSWDWDGCREDNKEFLSVDKLKQLSILTGFWERLIALCDVDLAAIAMIDEDQKEGVHRLFDKLADMHIDYISRVNSTCDIDCVQMHDDAAHKTGPFFSLATALEMLVPYWKRVADHCHSLGLYFGLHCCGKAEMLVPAFIEAGVDIWSAQDLNDFDMLLEKYGDSKLVYSMRGQYVSPEASEEEARAAAKEWVNKYKNKRVVNEYQTNHPAFDEAVYEYSRRAYEN